MYGSTDESMLSQHATITPPMTAPTLASMTTTLVSTSRTSNENYFISYCILFISHIFEILFSGLIIMFFVDIPDLLYIGFRVLFFITLVNHCILFIIFIITLIYKLYHITYGLQSEDSSRKDIFVKIFMYWNVAISFIDGINVIYCGVTLSGNIIYMFIALFIPLILSISRYCVLYHILYSLKDFIYMFGSDLLKGWILFDFADLYDIIFVISVIGTRAEMGSIVVCGFVLYTTVIYINFINLNALDDIRGSVKFLWIISRAVNLVFLFLRVYILAKTGWGWYGFIAILKEIIKVIQLIIELTHYFILKCRGIIIFDKTDYKYIP